jgi:MFS family permease
MLRAWSIVAACLVCQIGMGAGGYVLPVLLKPVVGELGWSRADFALANPVLTFAVAVAGVFVGWITQRRGPRLVLLAGSVLISAALLAAARMQTPAHLYAVSVALGVGVACLGDLPTGAAISARFTSQRGLAFGAVYIGSNIGGALAAVVVSALAVGASWRYGLNVIGVALLLLLLPAAASVGPPARTWHRQGEAEEEESLPTSLLLRERDFWLFFLAIFLFYFYRLGVNVHLVAFLSDLGYSEQAAAGHFGLTLAMGIGGKLIVGGFADRIGPRAGVLLNFAFIAVASAFLLLARMPGAIPAFLVLHGVFTAAEDVVVPLFVSQRFGAHNLARVYGLLLLALVPGGSLGPVLAGRVFDLTGAYTPVFTSFVVANVVAIAALAAVRTTTVAGKTSRSA